VERVTRSTKAGFSIASGRLPGAQSKTAYVTTGPVDNVVPISTATHTAGTPINVPSEALLIAITPDGRTAYVCVGTEPSTLVPINTAGKAINAGPPWGVAITPDGRTVYAPTGSDTVVPVSTATNVPGKAIKVGNGPGLSRSPRTAGPPTSPTTDRRPSPLLTQRPTRPARPSGSETCPTPSRSPDCGMSATPGAWRTPRQASRRRRRRRRTRSPPFTLHIRVHGTKVTARGLPAREAHRDG